MLCQSGVGLGAARVGLNDQSQSQIKGEAAKRKRKCLLIQEDNRGLVN